MKPICVECKLFFKPKKNEVAFEEGFGDGTGKPYKLWLADLWECRGCGRQIIVGAGASPVAEHYQPDYAQSQAHFAPMLLVDDC
jgi:hypothetical protein